MLVLYIVLSLLISLTITLAYMSSAEKTSQQNKVTMSVTYTCLFIGVILVWPFILLSVDFVLISKLVKRNKSKQVDSQNTSKK